MDEQNRHADITFTVILDEDGDYRVHNDASEAQDLYSNEVGSSGLATEVITITLRKQCPKPIVVSADLPQTDSIYKLEVKQS